MIRRGFWLTAGAVTGIYGYRRVSAVGRRLSASLNPAEPAAAPTRKAQVTRQGRRTVIRAAPETYRFTRDVREGMDLYIARHSERPGSTLLPGSTQLPGAGLRPGAGLAAQDKTYDPRPKDGH